MSEINSHIRAMVDKRSLGYCERCGGPGRDQHHRKRGNPRQHTPMNIVKLCRPCHEWATESPNAAKQTGWVLEREEGASLIPVPLLGRIWAFLHPTGVYVIQGSTMRDIRDVWESAEVEWFPRPERSLTLPDGPTVLPGEPDALPPAESGGGDEIVEPVGRVGVPASFRYQSGDTVKDFLLRLDKEEQAVDGVDETVEAVDEVGENDAVTHSSKGTIEVHNPEEEQ